MFFPKLYTFLQEPLNYCLHHLQAVWCAIVSMIISYVTSPPKIFLISVLVLVAYASDPGSFAMAWNQGRAAMIAVIPLAMLEMGRGAFSREPWMRARYGYMVLGVSVAYYLIWTLTSARDLVTRFAIRQGVSPSVAPFSPVQSVDYGVTTIMLASLTLVVLRSKAVTPVLYLGGMTAFLFVDAALPYDSLGLLQFVVPSILVFVGAIVNASGLGGAFAQNNILTLTRGGGFMNLAVFWPSAGVHSIIITLLATIGLSAKLHTSANRTLAYLGLGILGSLIVNVFRISLLSLYALGNISDPEAFERFHSVAGEILFLPWIAGYLLWLVRRETHFKHEPTRIKSHAVDADRS